MKNGLSIFIISEKLNRTQDSAYFKIRHAKTNYPSPIDEKTKNFPSYQIRGRGTQQKRQNGQEGILSALAPAILI